MKFYDKEELKTSRIFFDKQPPKYMHIFLVFICVLLLILFCFSIYGMKTYIVRGNGEIIANDNQYVASNVNGTIIKIEKEEGSIVKKGDILFVASNGARGVQETAMDEQLSLAEEKQAAMNLFEESLKDDKNYLENKGVQQEYYGKAEYYLLQVKEDRLSNEQQRNELSKKNDKLEKLNKEIAELKTHNSDENQLSLENKINEMDSLKAEVDTFNLQMKSISQSEKLKTQFISELGTSRTQLETQITELKGNQLVSKSEDDTYIAKAENDGIVHYRIPIKLGMSVQINQVIAEVSKNQKSDYLVEAYVSATDISKIKLQDKVNISIIGVNAQVYGALKGKIISIDNGTITQETSDGNLLVYRCLISLDYTELEGKGNTSIDIKKSMPVEVQIVYEKESYLDWMLELLSFKN